MHGAGSASFVIHVKNYINLYLANVLVIMETKIDKDIVVKCIAKIGWSDVARVDPIGFYRGIWLLTR